jgi:predicted small lipoprotein YifL
MPPNPRQSLLLRQRGSSRKGLLVASFVISMLFAVSGKTGAQGPGVLPPMPREAPVEAPNTSNSEAREQPVATPQRTVRVIDQGLRITIPKKFAAAQRINDSGCLVGRDPANAGLAWGGESGPGPNRAGAAPCHGPGRRSQSADRRQSCAATGIGGDLRRRFRKYG